MREAAIIFFHPLSDFLLDRACSAIDRKWSHFLSRLARDRFAMPGPGQVRHAGPGQAPHAWPGTGSPCWPGTGSPRWPGTGSQGVISQGEIP